MIKVYNNEVRENCAEIICPYCNGKHFIIRNHPDDRCMACKSNLPIPQACISGKVLGRFKYHETGWFFNDYKMLERLNRMVND